MLHDQNTITEFDLGKITMTLPDFYPYEKVRSLIKIQIITA